MMRTRSSTRTHSAVSGSWANVDELRQALESPVRVLDRLPAPLATGLVERRFGGPLGSPGTMHPRRES
jgi:hypothetical protein